MLGSMWKSIVEALGGRVILLLLGGGAATVFGAYDAFRLAHPSGIGVGNVRMPLPALEPWWLWAICFVLIVTIIRFAWVEAKKLQAEPLLYFGDPFIHTVALTVSHERDPVKKHRNAVTPIVASVGLFNNPPIKAEHSKLRQAHVTLEFIDPDTNERIKKMDFARWADNIQLGHHDSPSNVDVLRYRDIEPNDGRNVIDVALKYRSEDHCHTFSSEGWPIENRGNPKWVLPKNLKKFDVRLIVKSTNWHDFVADFVLTNEGAGGALRLTKKIHRSS